MDYVGEQLGGFFAYLLSGSWAWFNSLSREEWVVVLGVACVCGFLCLRGFGSRSSY